MLGYLPYPGQTMVTYFVGHKRKSSEDAFSDDVLNPWNTFEHFKWCHSDDSFSKEIFNPWIIVLTHSAVPMCTSGEWLEVHFQSRGNNLDLLSGTQAQALWWCLWGGHLQSSDQDNDNFSGPQCFRVQNVLEFIFQYRKLMSTCLEGYKHKRSHDAFAEDIFNPWRRFRIL